MGDPVAASRQGESGWQSGSGWRGESGWQSGAGRVVRKVLITAGIGGLTYLVTALTHQSQVAALTLAAFLGGVTLVVQFLADFEARLVTLEQGQDRQSAQLRVLVEERFSAVSEATELFGRVQSSALREQVVGLARHANTISHDDPQLVRDLAQSQLERTAKLLRELSGGSEVVYEDGEDRDWLLALTRNARSNIDATSRGTLGDEGQFIDEGLWTTELGLRYLDAQRDAVRRGVTVRRLFLLERPELADHPAFRNILDQQKSVGVEVRVINYTDISSEPAYIADLAVFDNEISYELAPFRPFAAATPMFVGTTLVLDQERVRQRSHRFAVLWEAAHAPD